MSMATWTFITGGAESRKPAAGKLLVCVFLVAAVFPVSAQEIVKAGEFTAAQDDVQFLPGATVIVHNDIRDSKTKIYKFQSGKFVRIKTAMPAAISNWRSFNWENVDQYNQLDLNYFVDSNIPTFLPPYSKVKGYVTIPGLESDKTIVMLCYAAVPDSVPQQERATAGGGLRDLHLLMMSRKPGPTYTDTIYTKLADVLVAKEVGFGTMLVESQPAGTFVAVYFDSGGSASYESLAVFRIRAHPNHN
jgi:hypothetical protein